MNALVLLVILCNAVPLLVWWALAVLGPVALVWFGASIFAAYFVRALMRRNSRIFDHFKL